MIRPRTRGSDSPSASSTGPCTLWSVTALSIEASQTSLPPPKGREGGLTGSAVRHSCESNQAFSLVKASSLRPPLLDEIARITERACARRVTSRAPGARSRSSPWPQHGHSTATAPCRACPRSLPVALWDVARATERRLSERASLAADLSSDRVSRRRVDRRRRRPPHSHACAPPLKDRRVRCCDDGEVRGDVTGAAHESSGSSRRPGDASHV